jgi:hypothetical protein
MKFSQFADCEKLESEITECIRYLNGFLWSDSKKNQHFVIPKLNLIIRPNIDIKLFLDVTKEYRSNSRFLTRVAALIYIGLVVAAIRVRLGSLFLKVLSLETSEFYPIIIGGNNRLRFVDSSNNNALLVAKNCRSIFFTKNAMRAYHKENFFDLEIIPELLMINERVYLEKQISGIAINRMVLTDLQERLLNNSMDAFFLKQQDLSRVISLGTFLRYKTSILLNYSDRAESTKIEELSQLFITMGKRIEKYFGEYEVSVCPSHGDLNRGNVFLDGNKVNIIDWEYFMYRNVDYDPVIFRHDLRHKKLTDYVNFFERNVNFDFNVIIFLTEELSFRILNFKRDVSDSQLYIETLTRLINNKLLIEKIK